MKIEEIHIYGYGKFEDVHIKNLKQLTVFYGYNEAGKSTIMSFIHSILFGFPLKQQNELRYEPKIGTKYGGKLVVTFPKIGKAIIERVKGKATGDVHVQLENGKIGGEPLLNELLKNIDKHIYQSVFSFNLHGLQNVHQLSSEDLGKFLFSTGTVGTEKLLTVEKKLQKEMENRFKPFGKKPPLNQKLKEVDELYRQVERAKEQNEAYFEFVREKEELEKEIVNLEEELTSLQKKFYELEEWERLAPIVKEKNLLEGQLGEINIESFPTDGILRYEQIVQMLQSLKNKLDVLENKLEETKKELAENEPNHELIAAESEINVAIENLTLYNALKGEEGEWQEKERKWEREIRDLQEQLNLSIEDVEKINTTLLLQSKTEEIQQKVRHLKERKNELDRLFAEEKEKLEMLEENIASLERQLLTEEKRNELTEVVTKGTDKEKIQSELFHIKGKIELLQRGMKKEKGEQRKNKLQFIFFFTMFLLLGIWGVYDQYFPIIVISVLGMIGVLFFIWKKGQRESREDDKDLNALKEKEKILEAMLQQFDDGKVQLAEEQLKKDDLIRNEQVLLKMRLEQQNEQYEKVIQGYEAWEEESRNLHGEVQALTNELGFPFSVPPETIHDYFLLVMRLKDSLKEWNYTKTQLNKKKEQMAEIIKGIENLQDRFMKKEKSLSETVYELKNQLKAELKKEVKHAETVKKYEDYIEQYEEVKKEFDFYLNEQKKLFSLAMVDHEEDFRKKGKEWARKETLRQQIEERKREIERSPLTDITPFEQIENITIEKEKIQKEIQLHKERIQTNNKRLAEVNHHIRVLEEGGTYSHLLHKYNVLLSELKMEGAEWAKYAIAKTVLTKTMETFHQEHLPKMLQQGEQYLSFLTNGEYIRMMIKDDSKGFVIERKDHLLFEANELSQATMEQVYVSLRLALATTIYKKYQMPILIDDSFVNFDENRTKKVIKLLKQMENHQILFFTCHNRFLHYFENEHIFDLNRQATIHVPSE